MVCSQQKYFDRCIKDLGGMLNLSFGSSTNQKTNTQTAGSDVTENPKSSVFGRNDKQ